MVLHPGHRHHAIPNRLCSPCTHANFKKTMVKVSIFVANYRTRKKYQISRQIQGFKKVRQIATCSLFSENATYLFSNLTFSFTTNVHTTIAWSRIGRGTDRIITSDFRHVILAVDPGSQGYLSVDTGSI